MAKPQLPRELHQLLALIVLAALTALVMLSLAVVLMPRSCHNAQVNGNTFEFHLGQ
ncbi:hypothetical protein L6R46_17340 [Myxococcota bacterium]|nr:hypothetical protein [Myxococcota bacterium]